MKRAFLWSIAAIVTLAALLTTVYLFRGKTIAPFLKDILVDRIESELGVRVAIGKISGTFLTSLELSDVRTLEADPEKGPVTSLALRHGKATYSLLDLFSGTDYFIGNADILLESARVELDLDRRPKKKKEVEKPLKLPAPASFPDITLRDSLLTLKGHGLHLRGQTIDAELKGPQQTDGKPARLDLAVQEADLNHPRLAKQSGPLEARLLYNGRQLVLQYLRFRDEQVVERADLKLPADRNQPFELTASLEAFAGHMRLHGSLQAKELAANIETSDIDLHHISSFFSSPGFPELAGMLNGSTAFSLNTDQPAETLAGWLKVHLQDGSIRRITANTLRLEAAARHGEILIRNFEGQVDANTLTIQGIGVPAETLFHRKWARLLDASPGTFSLRFNNIPALLKAAGLEKEKWPARIPEHQLELQGELGNRKAAISQGLLKTEHGAITIRQARLDLPPEGTPLSKSSVEGNLSLDISNLSDLADIFGLASLRGSLTGRVSLAGTIGSPRGQATATGQGLVFRDTSLGNLQVAALADQKVITVKTLDVERAGDRLSGRGAFRLKDRYLEDLQVELTIQEISHYRTLLPTDTELAGELSGTISAEGPITHPDLQIDAALQNGKYADFSVQGAALKAQSRKDTLTIEQAEITTSSGSITTKGKVVRDPRNRHFEARIASFLMTTPEGGRLQLARPSRLTYSRAGVFGAQDLKLSGNIGSIYLNGKFGRQIDSNLTVRISNLTSRYWFSRLGVDRFSFDDLDVDLTLQGALKSPNFHAAGQITDLSIQDVPFPVNGAFDLDFTQKGFNFRQFELSGRDDLNVTLTGTLPLNPWRKEKFLPGSIALSGRVEVPSLQLVQALAKPGFDLKGALGGDIRLTGTWREPTGHVQIHGWGVQLEHPRLPNPRQPFDLTADLMVKGNELTMNALRITSPDIKFTADGKWTQGPPLRNILRGHDLRLAGFVDFKGNLQMPDISWLARDRRQIRHLGGSLQAELALEGAAQDPKVDGKLHLSKGELQTTWAMPPIKALEISAAMDESRLTLQTAKGELGSASFTLGGTIARGEEQGPVFDLDLKGSNLLLFRNDWLMIRADTDLMVDGPLDQLGVSGNLDLTSGYYQKNIDFLNILRGSDKPKPQKGLQLFSIREGPLKNMTFDVKINTKNPFRIENNVAKGTVRPQLTLAGNGELPLLLGKIYIDETRIRLPTTKLQVDSGLIQFRESNPFQPTVDLLAHTKMAGYDINMQVEGTYSRPIVTLSSVPPLPHDDLLLLLLAGKLPQNGTGKEVAETGGINLAMYVGKGLLADWFTNGSPGDDESFLDRLQIEIGRGITQTGRETVETQFELADDVLHRDDALYITAERDIYDDYNVGVKIVFRFR